MKGNGIMGRRPKEAIQKSIPSSENGPRVAHETASGQIYKVTENLKTKKHTLWQNLDGGWKKLKSADSPYDLYEFIDYDN